MIEYHLEDSGIVYINFSDKITFEDLKSYLKEFKNIKNLPSDLLLLYDMQKANLEFDADDIPSILQLADEATVKYPKVKTAFLVDSPKLTAYSMLFNNTAPTENRTRDVFSTRSVAITWLKKQ